MKLCSAILLSHIFLCKCTSILLAPGSFFPATYPITITSMVLDNVQNMANHLDQRIVRLFHQDSITGVSYVWCYKGTGSEGCPGLLQYPLHCLNLHNAVLHSNLLLQGSQPGNYISETPLPQSPGSMWLPRGIQVGSGEEKEEPLFSPQQLQIGSWASANGWDVDVPAACRSPPKTDTHSSHELWRSPAANPPGALQPLVSKQASLWLLLSRFPESQQQPPWPLLSCPALQRVLETFSSLY